MARLELSGKILTRNTILNFIGQVVPLLVGIATIPFIVRGLGTERFGLLSLAWVILGYFAMFDLGLGWATTKFVAEALGKGEEDLIPRIVWTTVSVQAILGIMGGLALAGISPLLVERVLKIPPELLGEAKATFCLLALFIPVVLVSGSFRGVLEASQRFDLVNAVKISSNALAFVLPLVGALLGFCLPGIIVLILLVRLVVLVALIVLNLHLFSKLRRFLPSFSLFPSLFTYGGWIMVSNIVKPMLIYLDRFLIGSFLSMAALTYYSAPYEVMTRLQILPASLTMTLFPAFSTLQGSEDRQKLNTVFARATKYILLFLGPIALTLMLFSKQIMQVWLGPEFAQESAVVLQILTIGVIVNSLAYVPSALLSGGGRPDVPAKIHLLELPVYIGIAWFLIKEQGIVGAAWAWTLRVTLDAILLFTAAFRIYRFPLWLLTTNGALLTSIAFVMLLGISWSLKVFGRAFLPLSIYILIFTALLGAFGYFCWRKTLTSLERETFLKTIKLWRG